MLWVSKFEHWASIFEDNADKIISRLNSSKWAVAAIGFILGAWLIDFLKVDPDLFARVAMGRLVELDGSVPTQDPFAFSPKKAIWIDHEWLAGVVFYQISQLGGDLGLFSLKLAFVFVTLIFLALAQSKFAPQAQSRFFWLVWGGFECAYLWSSTIRAQAFTVLFLASLVYFIGVFKSQRKILALLPLPIVFVVWANSHGGFVVGLGILGLWAVFELGHRRIGPALLWLTCVAATLINPYGFQYWEFMYAALSLTRSSISEWQPVSLKDPGALSFLMLLGLFFWGFGRRIKTADYFIFGAICVCALGALKHQRFIGLASILLITLGLSYLDASLLGIRNKWPQFWARCCRSTVPVLFLGMLWAAGMWLGFLQQLGNFKLDYSGYPVGAVSWLTQSNATGKVLVDFNSGSFALWKLYPRFRISLDGRYEEVYPESTLSLVDQALSPGHEYHLKALGQLQPDFILSAATGPNFGPPWRKAYQDSKFAIWQVSASKVEVNEIAGPDANSDANFVNRIWEPTY